MHFPPQETPMDPNEIFFMHIGLRLCFYVIRFLSFLRFLIY